MRLAFAVLSPLFLVLCVVAIRSEEAEEWMRYHDEFSQLYADRARQARGGRSNKRHPGVARWQRIVDEAVRLEPEVKQVYLEEIKVADRCLTCHLASRIRCSKMRRSPSARIRGLLESHDVNYFGCTSAMMGRTGDHVDAAHGYEDNWSKAMLPTVFSRARATAVTSQHAWRGRELTKGADLFMRGLLRLPRHQESQLLAQVLPTLRRPEVEADGAGGVGTGLDQGPPSPRCRHIDANYHLTEEQIGQITAFLLTSRADQEGPLSWMSVVEDGKKLFTDVDVEAATAWRLTRKARQPACLSSARLAPRSNGMARSLVSDAKKVNADTAMPKWRSKTPSDTQ